jgi:hypothetical protein
MEPAWASNKYKGGGAVILKTSFIIEKLIGPRVTVIGSQEPYFRYRFQEQMILSITQGKPFLGCFECRQKRVLCLKSGKADFTDTEQRIFNRSNGQLDIIQNKYRIESSIRSEEANAYQGLLGYLRDFKKDNSDLGIIFLPDFNDIRTGIKAYVDNELGTSKEINGGDPKYLNFVYDRDITNIKRLRDFSAEHHIPIVTAHDLNLSNKFALSYGPKYADNKIYLINSKGQWKLKIAESTYVPSATWELEHDDFSHFSLTKKEAERMKRLSLNEKEKRLIDAMWGKGPMRLKDIEDESGLAHSTVVQKLEALQTPEKGRWIIKHPDKTYEVDQTKERPWIESNG